MPTTSSSGLPYPASSAAPNVPADVQALANALDTKVVVPVANTTARNALTKYDGMLTYEQSTKRTFRWNATLAAWEFVGGPWYTWTPTLIDNGGAAVTGASATNGAYTIVNAHIEFECDIKFGAAIDGKITPLRLQLPAGIVARTSASLPPASGVTARLYNPSTNSNWLGFGLAASASSAVAIHFPINASTPYMRPFQNATGAGATGTGVPLISGSYPLESGGEFQAWGRIALTSWTAL